MSHFRNSLNTVNTAVARLTAATGSSPVAAMKFPAGGRGFAPVVA